MALHHLCKVLAREQPDKEPIRIGDGERDSLGAMKPI
jgi:hypothetical protein